MPNRSKESEAQPSEAAMYVVEGRAGNEVVLVVDPVYEAWVYTEGAVMSALSGGQDLGEGKPWWD